MLSFASVRSFNYHHHYKQQTNKTKINKISNNKFFTHCRRRRYLEKQPTVDWSSAAGSASATDDVADGVCSPASDDLADCSCDADTYTRRRIRLANSNQIKSIYLSTNQINRVDRTPRKVKPSLTDAPNNRVDIAHKHDYATTQLGI